MDKALVKVAREERGAMAGRLLGLAKELGHPVSVVESKVNGYLVPVDVAQRLADDASKGNREREVKEPQKKAAPAEPEPADVRAWARENDYEVSDKGRIPAEVLEAYQKANG